MESSPARKFSQMIRHVRDTWPELKLTLPDEMESFADHYERTWIGTDNVTTYWPAFLDLLTSLKDDTTLFSVSWAAVILAFGASSMS